MTLTENSRSMSASVVSSIDPRQVHAGVRDRRVQRSEALLAQRYGRGVGVGRCDVPDQPW